MPRSPPRTVAAAGAQRRDARAPALARAARRARRRRGRRGRSRSAHRSPSAPSTGRTIRSRPSVASTGSTSRSSTDAYSARSPAPWAIFVPEGVTRNRKMSAATSCSSLGQLLDGAVEIRADDRLRAAERRERLARATRPILPSAPRPRSRSSTSWRYGASIRALIALPGREAATRFAEIDLSGRGLVEHVVDQRRLDLDRLAARLVVALDRPHDRLPRRGAVEVVEAKVVREQVRNAPLEAIELGEGVVAEREQDTHAQSGAGHELGELARETGLLGVVEEVLLGLVEHEQQVAGERLGPAAEACPRAARPRPRRAARNRTGRPARRAQPGEARPRGRRSTGRRRRRRTPGGRAPRRSPSRLLADDAPPPRAAASSFRPRSARTAPSGGRRGRSR